MRHAGLDALLQSLLEKRRSSSQLRQLATAKIIDAAHIQIEGHPYINFCSNDYLGLTHHPKVLAAAKSAIAANGFGSASSALITGHTIAHASAEQALADWKQTESAVILPSGYQANLAAIQTLGAVAKQSRRPIRFLVDKLVHASIIDAVKGSRGGESVTRVFPHNHLGKLKRLLAEAPERSFDVVVTDSIFSMDGDAADLAGLARLKQEYDFVLMLDEAHASGVYGTAGAGYAHQLGLQNAVDISIVTLSKAFGSIGGAICARRIFCQGVTNFGRAFIYTTSLPAAAASAAEAAIGIMRDEPHRQQRVLALARRVRDDLAAAGFSLPPGDSPIICVILKSEDRALAAAESLRKQGLLTAAVRPPTVAPNSSRLRITLSCEHSDDDIARLIAALRFG